MCALLNRKGWRGTGDKPHGSENDHSKVPNKRMDSLKEGTKDENPKEKKILSSRRNILLWEKISKVLLPP